MFALEFRFPARRYHATPWGRGVNEAAVAWPPEPWRVLRALIAAYWRKGDHARWSSDDLADLIDGLSEELPVYQLPEGVIHAHTQHFMPIGEIQKGRERTTLVFDAFLRLPAEAPLIMAWPSVSPDEHLFNMASALARSVSYLGRAESWVDCAVHRDWSGAQTLNCRPAADGFEGQSVRVLAPLTATEYSGARQRLRADIQNETVRTSRGKWNASRVRRETEKRLRSKVTGRDTLPERLADALSLDTSDLQERGWTRPPASQEVLYSLDPGAVPGVVSRIRKPRRTAARALPTVARFLLAGRSLPRVEESVKIGEVMRLAALHKFGWERDKRGEGRIPKAPWQISGRGPDGKPLRIHTHDHAFWLPEDVDRDGWIDHISVFVRSGITDDVRRRLDSITRLWESGSPTRAAGGTSGQREWRLALESMGIHEDFAAASRLFGEARRWRSVTPFLASGHLKSAGHPGEALRLLRRRGFDVGAVGVVRIPHIPIGGSSRRSLQFHRFRQRGREKQPDAAGAFLEIAFPEPIQGPLALGYGSHFGLGLFERADE